MKNEAFPQAPETPLKPVRTILSQEIHQAREELDRPVHGIFVSGLLAGIGVGASTLALAVVLTIAGGRLPHPVVEILAANAYTVGFIAVILAHTDLFTEYTTIAILPVLTRHAGIGSLARLWGLVYAGNLIGAAIFALLLAHLGPALQVVEPRALEGVARRLVEHSGWVILLSALLTGWMMGLLSWLIAAGKDTISQIFFVWLITGVIGLSHLHHAITGGLDVLTAMLMGVPISASSFLNMLLLTTLGNAAGGALFAVLIRYSLVMGEVSEGRTARSESGDRKARRES